MSEVFRVGKTIYPYMVNGGNIHERVMDVIADYFRISVEDIKGRSRKHLHVTARHLFHYFMYYIYVERNDIKYNYGQASVGRFTGKDHATVLHSCRIVRDSKGLFGTVKKTMRQMRDDIWLEIQRKTLLGEIVRLNLDKKSIQEFG